MKIKNVLLSLIILLVLITGVSCAQEMTEPAETPTPVTTPEPEPASGLSYFVVDTGQDKCYDESAEITPPEPGEAFFGQDAQYAGAQPSYTLSGDGNGAIRKYFNEFGECQESGRDQAHTQMGLGYLGCAAEIAWKQGVDLYGAYDNRLALGFEYTAKYNLGHDVPYEPYRSHEGRYHYPKISDNSRGRFSSIYERVYHHYHGRMGLEMPFTAQVIEKIRPERWRSSHASWGTLMHAGQPAN